MTYCYELVKTAAKTNAQAICGIADSYYQHIMESTELFDGQHHKLWNVSFASVCNAGGYF